MLGIKGVREHDLKEGLKMQEDIFFQMLWSPRFTTFRTNMVIPRYLL